MYAYEFALRVQLGLGQLPARGAIFERRKVERKAERVVVGRGRGVDDADFAFRRGLGGRKQDGQEELGEVEVT